MEPLPIPWPMRAPLPTVNLNASIDALRNVSVTFPPIYDELLANGTMSQELYDSLKDLYEDMNETVAENLENAEAQYEYLKVTNELANKSANGELTFTPSTKSSGMTPASIVGISLGAIATIALIIGVYIMYKRKDRGKKNNWDNGDEDTLDSSTYGSAQTPDIQAVIPWDDESLLAVRVPLDKVDRGEPLSRGAFGEVYRGVFRNEAVAIKMLLPDKRKDVKMIKLFVAEIKFMSTIDHPRIVSFIGVAWEALSDLCVIAEFMEGGDLFTTLNQWENEHPRRARGFDPSKNKIALHVAHALTYLHSLETVVVHRDLKSKNVLLDADGNAKLTDFGVSRERIDRTMTAGVGSSLWMAPEVMLGERYSEKADIFSFGVMLSELDTQQLPYADAVEQGTSQPLPQTAILQLVSLGHLTITITDYTKRTYPAVYTLAKECVSMDPKKRPTAAEALHRLHMISKQ